MATTTSSATDNSASALYATLNKGSGSSATSSSQLSETQGRFLKLLTTQLKNQDPLNPLDNAQMTSQMAQISTVDGIERLNATLQKLINNSTESQTMQAAALVGHGVLVPGSDVSFSSDGTGLAGVDLATAADKVTVTIKDANGLTVRTLQLGSMAAGSHSFSWDGKADNGEAVAQGSYTFGVSAVQGTDKVTATALSVGLVSSVERAATGMSLNVGKLGTFAMSDVREIL